MGFVSAIIGAVGAAKARKRAIQDLKLNGLRQREAAELAGFNPLFYLNAIGGGGGMLPSGYSNTLGSDLADAGMMLGDKLAKNTSEQKLELAERQNRYLTDKVQRMTLRPTVPGIYGPAGGNGGLNGAPAGQSVVLDGGGGVSRDTADLAADGLEPLRTVHPFDPRREVDNKPVATHPGFIAIDNPAFGPMNVPSLDGDEALSIGEYPTALYAWATRERGLGYRAYSAMRDGSWRAAIPQITLAAPPQNPLLDGVKKYAKKKKPKHALHSLGF